MIKINNKKLALMEFLNINELIKEFLKYNSYNSSLECFEAEEQIRKLNNNVSEFKNIFYYPSVQLNRALKRHQNYIKYVKPIMEGIQNLRKICLK